MDCIPSGSSVHGILQARYWNVLPFLLQGIFPTQGSNPGLPRCRQILYPLSHQGSPVVSIIMLNGQGEHAALLQLPSLPVQQGREDVTDIIQMRLREGLPQGHRAAGGGAQIGSQVCQDPGGGKCKGPRPSTARCRNSPYKEQLFLQGLVPWVSTIYMS